MIINTRENRHYDNQIWISLSRLCYGAGSDSGQQRVRPDSLNMYLAGNMLSAT